MRERPIIFSSPLIPLLLSDKTTQTRRVIKSQPKLTRGKRGIQIIRDEFYEYPEGIIRRASVLKKDFKRASMFPCHCPYGQPGDRLWVRESFAILSGVEQCPWPDMPHRIVGEYDYPGTPLTACLVWRSSFDRASPPKWKPSIFMFRWASRITLEITDVRVERLQDISEEDAKADCGKDKCCEAEGHGAIIAFQGLWNFLNERRGWGWEKNPFVWVISFRMIK